MKNQKDDRLLTLVAMLGIIGFECIAAFVFHKDGLYLMVAGVALICLASPECRRFVLTNLPKLIPRLGGSKRENL